MPKGHLVTRRSLLRGCLGLGGAAVAGPLLIKDRPLLTHGVMAGDVTADSAVVWTRADRGGAMRVEWSARPDFADARTVRGASFLADNDFTGKARLRDLPYGETIHYRVRADDGAASVPVTGSFRTAPREGRDVRFVWSADIAGQGWGINPDFGGYTLFDDMAAADPDFFLCSGDFYYGDSPLTETVELDDGRVWRNIVTEETAKVAETLDEFRARYKYNLTDEPLSRFLATVPMVNQWDDHEVINNWYPGEIHDDDRYRVRDVDTLAARARTAFTEYTPNALEPDGQGRIHRRISHGPLLDVFTLDMRSFRGSNAAAKNDAAATLFGPEQLAWLKRQLSASTATWKVIANDMPLCLVLDDGGSGVDNVAQGDPGAPGGREAEIAELLSYIKAQDITGTVWITAEVHHTAAHHYDPSRAAFTDFNPFWEFVSGPAHAGSIPRLSTDTTFGAEAVFAKSPESGIVGPLDGYQFFGEISIDAASRAMTVRLLEQGGKELFRTELAAA